METTAGPIQGKVDSAVIAFLGIPYGKAPVGELRWQPPHPAQPWNKVLDATRFRPHCLDSLLPATQSDGSEDCLFLNVFTPLNPPGAPGRTAQPLPVMVWIYGGSNVSGASEFYDPSPLVTTGEGAVVVTLNYRLGPFGFFAHPALDKPGAPAANQGVMDQQLALRWVQQNIASFGGDPRNVTLFGESAGGMNVMSNLVSPLSAGLFHRAIVQSGAYLLDTPSLTASQQRGIAFAKRVGCTEQPASCLRKLRAAKILENADPAGPNRAFEFATVDGRVLKETQRAALTSGRFNRVPVLTGNNKDEGLLFMDPKLSMDGHKQMLELLVPPAGKDPERALAIYSLENFPSAYEAASAAHGDQFYACNAQHSSRLMEKWVPVFGYEFADAGASTLRAAHATELKYLFNVSYSKELMNGAWQRAWTATAGRPDDLSAGSKQLSLAMRTSWLNFARTGNPQSALIPDWPAARKGIQVLKPGAPAVQSPEAFASAHRCSFWN